MLTTLTHTTKPKSATTINRKWVLLDAAGMVLGRVATKSSRILQGKQKVDYVDHLDTGDSLVIINASQVTISGRKSIQKVYSNYSGFPGGLRKQAFEQFFAKQPQEVVRHAISGMLPKNKLRDRRLARLHIFPNAFHTFQKELA